MRHDSRSEGKKQMGAAPRTCSSPITAKTWAGIQPFFIMHQGLIALFSPVDCCLLLCVQYTIGGVALVKLGGDSGERVGLDSEGLDLSLLVYVRGVSNTDWKAEKAWVCDRRCT